MLWQEVAVGPNKEKLDLMEKKIQEQSKWEFHKPDNINTGTVGGFCVQSSAKYEIYAVGNG